MLMRFDKKLERQEIYAVGDELALVMGKDRDAEGRRRYTRPDEPPLLVATLYDPVLVTDFEKIGRLPQYDEVEKIATRDTVRRLLQFPVLSVEYEGTKIMFEQGKYDGLWDPSIDTLLFCYGISMLDGSRKDYPFWHTINIVEVGG